MPAKDTRGFAYRQRVPQIRVPACPTSSFMWNSPGVLAPGSSHRLRISMFCSLSIFALKSSNVKVPNNGRYDCCNSVHMRPNSVSHIPVLIVLRFLCVVRRWSLDPCCFLDFVSRFGLKSMRINRNFNSGSKSMTFDAVQQDLRYDGPRWQGSQKM